MRGQGGWLLKCSKTIEGFSGDWKNVHRSHLRVLDRNFCCSNEILQNLRVTL